MRESKTSTGNICKNLVQASSERKIHIITNQFSHQCLTSGQATNSKYNNIIVNLTKCVVLTVTYQTLNTMPTESLVWEKKE